MTIVPLIITILGGFIVGSFLSVVIKRIKKNEKGIVLGRSRCPHCKVKLKAQELIPIVSYIIQKGLCRNCKEKISPFYPSIEILTALFFALIFIKFNPFTEEILNAGTKEIALSMTMLIIAFIYAGILIATFFYDLLYMEIPDKILIPGIIFALTSTIFPFSPHLIDGLIGASIPVVFFGLQILISKGKWIGAGDLRIGAFMGLILGYKGVLLALFLGYIIGAIVSSFLLLTKKTTLKTQIPFGPFLVIGTIITFLFREEILNWYFNLFSF
ncbi:prepilin peptidase [Candidatus Peregrinibacteria bacterium]|nr:prepilin peptidase [Candidatus Peregrinibacteria bacterium]